jgi:hypothetical protein
VEAEVFPRSTAPDREALLDLRAALERLAPRRRAVIVLRYYCDQSIEQTARLLGCSEGTVKSQTSRALAQLHDVLAPLPDAPPKPAPLSTGGTGSPAARRINLMIPMTSSMPSLPGRTR